MKLLVIIAAALMAHLLLSGGRSPNLTDLEWPHDAPWMEANDDAQARAYFRYDIELPPITIDRAWITVASDLGQEFIINGNPVSRWTAWRPTRPFLNGHSKYGQRPTQDPPLLALNFPREHQWSDHANWRLPLVTDITPHLKSGQKNTLAIRVESRDGSPSTALFGEILLSTGETIPIRSGSHWKAASRPGIYGERGWLLSRNPIPNWLPALEVRPPGTGHYTTVPLPAFTTPFTGHWDINGSSLTSSFTTPDIRTKKTWARVLATGSYLLKIDGQVVRALTGAGYHPSQGDWIASPASRRNLAVPPELLDPAEASALHSGDGFLSPSHGDPTALDFSTNDEALDLSQDTLAADERGDSLRRHLDTAITQGAAGPAQSEAPTARIPTALNKPAAPIDFTAFDITPYLDSGTKHTIELTPILPPASLYPIAPRYAWDIGSTTILASSTAGRRATPGTDLAFYQTEGKPRSLFPWIALTLIASVVGIAFLKNPAPVATAVTLIVTGHLFAITLGEKSEALWFLAHPWWHWALLGLALASALFVHFYRVPAPKTEARSRQLIWPLLTLICVLAFVLRIYQVDIQAMDDDEYASVQAALSIAEKGTPELSPGIYYTRSPAYHYLAAAFIKVFGPHLWALRLPAIIAGIGCIITTYLIGSHIFKNRSLGLIAAFLLAIHPFEIFTSHIARFYQQQQLFALLTLFFFVVGFVERGAQWKRIATVICFGLGVLSQEISLVVIVPLGLCYALVARPQNWAKEISLAWITGLVIALVGMNLVAFKVICLTRLEGISPNAESTLKPHFWEPLNFLSLWLGYSRLHVFLSPFALFGIIQAFRTRHLGAMATSLFLLTGIAGIVFLVTGLGFRYQYSLLPMWLLLGVYGIREITRLTTAASGNLPRHALTAAIVTLATLAWCPWRILESYDQRLLGDSSGATAFVSANLRPGDKVAINEPHPHAALLETGQADYDLVVPILYDFVYRNPEGRLIDRNGGAEVMGRVSAVQQAMASHDRIWFLVNREKFRNRNRNHRWEYPGARLDFLLKQNTTLAYQGYLWDVYLWDRHSGTYAPFRTEPMAWNE